MRSADVLPVRRTDSCRSTANKSGHVGAALGGPRASLRRDVARACGMSRCASIPVITTMSLIGADTAGHEPRQALALIGREAQAELGAPPQHVLLGLRPFPLHQVAHLRAGEVGTEAWSEILQSPSRTENALETRSIRAHQPPRVLLAQERTRSARRRHQRLEAVRGEFAARQMRILGPRGTGLEHVRE